MPYFGFVNGYGCLLSKNVADHRCACSNPLAFPLLAIVSHRWSEISETISSFSLVPPFPPKLKKILRQFRPNTPVFPPPVGDKRINFLYFCRICLFGHNRGKSFAYCTSPSRSRLQPETSAAHFPDPATAPSAFSAQTAGRNNFANAQYGGPKPLRKRPIRRAETASQILPVFPTFRLDRISVALLGFTQLILPYY